MNARVKVTISKDSLPHVGARLRQRVGVINQQTAQAVADGAKQRAHVITGKLRDSIEAVKAGTLSWSVQAGSPDRDYWDAIAEEYGTSRRPPHPFLRPAFEARQGQHEALMEKAIDDIVKRFT